LDNGLDATHYKVPTTLPADDVAIRKLIVSLLSSGKGAGWAALLMEQCKPNELPTTAVEFLKKVYAYFPLPVATVAAGASTAKP
jgi:adenylosuccinate synthase